MKNVSRGREDFGRPQARASVSREPKAQALLEKNSGKYVAQSVYDETGTCIGHYRSRRAQACESAMAADEAWGVVSAGRLLCVSHWLDGAGEKSEWTDRCVVQSATAGEMTVTFQADLLEQSVPSSFVYDSRDCLSKAMTNVRMRPTLT